MCIRDSNVADGRAAGRAGEAAVCDERDGLVELHTRECARRVQHLAHAGAAARALVADHDDVAVLDLDVYKRQVNYHAQR